jgi:hypothetical protein
LRAGYEGKDIVNDDKTALFFKCLLNNTLKFKEETCHVGKLSKERLIAIFCTSITGKMSSYDTRYIEESSVF